MAVITFKTPYWYEIPYIFSPRVKVGGLCPVFDVLDGDTIIVLFNGKKIRVRLLGIDAPEKDQLYGLQSRHTLSGILADKHVTLSHTSIGRYRRTVAMVHCEGLNVNLEMIRRGGAWVYEKYCPSYLRQDWLNYQEIAKNGQVGLWSSLNPIAPWTWRRL